MFGTDIVYIDDSGTDPKSRIVTAAFCCSTADKWREFANKWSRIAEQAGFEYFHMSEFAACKRSKWCSQCCAGKTTVKDHPWRLWQTDKRRRVLYRLANTIVKYVEYGVGLAHLKEDYDKHVLAPSVRNAAVEPITSDQFVFCVQKCGRALAEWRATHRRYAPLRFVFDLSSKQQKEEIARVFLSPTDGIDQYQDGIEQWFNPVGISFESRKNVVQLLAADMLAWTSSTIRARQVFKTGGLTEVKQLGMMFSATKHIRVGYNTENAIAKAAKRLIDDALKKKTKI